MQKAFAYDLQREMRKHMLSPGPNSFKETAPASARRLSGFSLLGVSGVEAGAFLQAQTMNDLRALDPGCWHWNGWLSPKGRLICLFALWRREEQDFVALLPDFPAPELLPLLQRFVFRSKLKLQVLDSLVAAVDPAPPPLGARARERVQPVDGGWAFDFSGAAIPRRLLLLPEGHPALAPAEPGADAAWRAADLALGLPRLAASQGEAWTPQMLSLERLRAFSLNKGCYPGQEIVARTHFLGQAKRGLARLSGHGLAPGTAVEAGGRSIGAIVCTSADGAEALAVLQAERAPGPLLAAGAAVAELPLLDGLQRPA